MILQQEKLPLSMRDPGYAVIQKVSVFAQYRGNRRQSNHMAGDT